MIIISLSIGISALLFGMIALAISILALVKILSIERSTHTVQMVPAEDMIKENWATSEKEIEKQQKLYNEELSDKMEEFALNPEDKEIFSL